MVGSAVQNGMRLIVVVNGLEDPEDRATEAKKMLEWGFRNFEARTLFAAHQTIGYAKVFGGDSRSVKLASPEPIKVMVQKNGNDKLIARVVYSGPVRAPIESGQQVGVVRVWRGANVAMEAPVYAAESVGRGSTMRRGDRRRERTRHRHVPRAAPRSSEMAETAVKRTSGRGTFHHL